MKSTANIFFQYKQGAYLIYFVKHTENFHLWKNLEFCCFVPESFLCHKPQSFRWQNSFSLRTLTEMNQEVGLSARSLRPLEGCQPVASAWDSVRCLTVTACLQLQRAPCTACQSPLQLSPCPWVSSLAILRAGGGGRF